MGDRTEYAASNDHSSVAFREHPENVRCMLSGEADFGTRRFDSSPRKLLCRPDDAKLSEDASSNLPEESDGATHTSLAVDHTEKFEHHRGRRVNGSEDRHGNGISLSAATAIVQTALTENPPRPSGRTEDNELAGRMASAGEAVILPQPEHPPPKLSRDVPDGDKDLRTKDRSLGVTTSECDRGYPAEALRSAFPPESRHETVLVIGRCSLQLVDKMYSDGFRDVLVMDESAGSLAALMERAEGSGDSARECRYVPMAPKHRRLQADAFSGVIDNGVIDAVLAEESSGTTRRVFRELIRLLKPGGTLISLSALEMDSLEMVFRLGFHETPPKTYVTRYLAAGHGGARATDWLYAYEFRKEATAREIPTDLDLHADLGGQLAPTSMPEKITVSSNGTSAIDDGVRRKAANSEEGRGDSREPEGGVPGEGARDGPRTPNLQISDHEPGEARSSSSSSSFTEVLEDSPTRSSSNTDQLKRAARAQEEGEGKDGSSCTCQKQPVDVPITGEPCAGKDQFRRAPPKSLRRGAEENTSGAVPRKSIGVEARGSHGIEKLGGGHEAYALSSESGIPGDMVESSRGPPEQALGVGHAGRARESSLQANLERIAGQGLGLRGHAGETAVSDRGSGGSVKLPWGADDLHCSHDEEYLNVELKVEAELKATDFLVEIGATRVKICFRPKRGALQTVLDEELEHRIDVSESTWSIQDRRVLVLSLCKRAGDVWRQCFRSQEQGAMKVSGEKGVVGDAVFPTHRATPALASLGTQCPPARQSSDDSVGVALASFVPPDHLLIEQQSGVGIFQVYMSKPLGWQVTQARVIRSSTGECDVRYACRSKLSAIEVNRGDRQPELAFGTCLRLGRDDFQTDAASWKSGSSSGLVAFRIPFGPTCGKIHDSLDGSANDVDGDFDVRRVARLRCRQCSNILTPPGRGLTMRALPSGRWDDCIEDMICFEGPSAVPMLAREVAFARSGLCLLGSAEVLIHPDDLIVDEVVLEEDGEPSECPRCFSLGRPVRCRRCGSPLGRLAPLVPGQQQAINGGPSIESRGVLLLKHTLLGDNVTDMDSHGAGDGACRSDGGLLRSAGPAIDPVFASVTSVQWLMEEIEHELLVNRHRRFTLVIGGCLVSPSAACLGLIVMATHTRVSEDTRKEPRRAFRVAFREKLWGEDAEADLFVEDARPPGLQQGRDQGEKSEPGGAGLMENDKKKPKLLILAKSDYDEVRRKLVGASWTSIDGSAESAGNRFSSRGFLFSYMF